METPELRLVWTDPRTGTEYLICSSEAPETDVPWLITPYLVRNLRSGEQASVEHERMQRLQESLMELVDEAEDLISHRSGQHRNSSIWNAGRVVVSTMTGRAKRIRWRRDLSRRRIDQADQPAVRPD